jgi:hypothetical protein
MSNRLITQFSQASNVSTQAIKLYWQKMKRAEAKNILTKPDKGAMIPTKPDLKLPRKDSALKNRKRSGYLECIKFVAKEYTGIPLHTIRSSTVLKALIVKEACDLLQTEGVYAKESDKLIFTKLGARKWNGMNHHEGNVSEDVVTCNCDRGNTNIRCHFLRLAEISEDISPIALAQQHKRNCKAIAAQYQQLNVALQELGGCAWVLACIPHQSVPDIDEAVGTAAIALANDMEKLGYRMHALLRSRQTLVDLAKNNASSNLFVSESLANLITQAQTHCEKASCDDTENESQGELQERIRDKLQTLLRSQGVQMTKRNQLPPGIWKEFKILNWPSEKPVEKLNSISAKECRNILLRLNEIDIAEKGTHPNQHQITRDVFSETISEDINMMDQTELQEFSNTRRFLDYVLVPPPQQHHIDCSTLIEVNKTQSL